MGFKLAIAALTTLPLLYLWYDCYQKLRRCQGALAQSQSKVIELATQLQEELKQNLLKQIQLSRQQLEILDLLVRLAGAATGAAERSQEQMAQLEFLQYASTDMMHREEKLEGALRDSLRELGGDDEQIRMVLDRVLQ